MCRRRKLAMAFRAYAGFKLLFPASPLIVATLSGADVSTMSILCVIVFAPVWAAGLLYDRHAEGGSCMTPSRRNKPSPCDPLMAR